MSHYIKPEARVDMARAIRAAPHGERGAVVAWYAETYGVSRRWIEQQAAAINGPKHKARRKPRRKDYSEFIQAARECVDGIPNRGRRANLKGVYRFLERREFDERPHYATFVRLMAESADGAPLPLDLGADHSMDVVQIDASSSAYFYQSIGEANQYHVNVDRRVNKSGMKNKIVGGKRAARIRYYVCVDVCSGVIDVRSVAGKGEDAEETTFSLWSMLQDRSTPPFGRPGAVMCDLGGWSKHSASQNAMREAGINVAKGTAYNSQARGKVEKIFQSIFDDFEFSLLIDPDIPDKIHFSEFQKRLADWVIEFNNREQSDGLSRHDRFYLNLEKDHVREIPTLREIMLAPFERAIQPSGRIEFQKKVYTIPRRFNRKSVVGKRFRIWKDHNDLSHIYADLNGNGEKIECKLLEKTSLSHLANKCGRTAESVGRGKIGVAA